ncbi:hypothetical protein Q5P01_018868 [Channa striata]|uniref:Uncharacterized protein n=1 Tax=Channa striata TaxID=64152 RepID=A0AA88M8R9_CHASR|nr:hypothetical protein Q5P01_018868 [Channa striata]
MCSLSSEGNGRRNETNGHEELDTVNLQLLVQFDTNRPSGGKGRRPAKPTAICIPLFLLTLFIILSSSYTFIPPPPPELS